MKILIHMPQMLLLWLHTKKKTKKNIHTFNDSRQRTRMAPAVDVQVVATPAALLADPPLCSAIDRLGVLSAEVPPDVS
jgi:hypothetical protein